MNVVFRPVTEDDRKQIASWIEADASHRGVVRPELFLHGGDTASVYAVGDDQATAFYVRQESIGEITRMYIQFGPDKRRILEVFGPAYTIVKEDAKKRGFKNIIFSTCSPTMMKWLIPYGFVFYGKAEL